MQVPDSALYYLQIVYEALQKNKPNVSFTRPEVMFRMGVGGENRADVERFTREIVPLVLNGPPSVTGFAGGRPKVEEIVAYWPALLDKRAVSTAVSIMDRSMGIAGMRLRPSASRRAAGFRTVLLTPMRHTSSENPSLTGAALKSCPA